VIRLAGLRTGRGLNDREHWRVRAKRVKAEKDAAAWELARWAEKPPLPCVVTLTRFAPSNGLDDDNLAGSLKGVRDAVAAWLGVDDRDRKRVKYVYEQQRAAWAVGISFEGWP
jgi:hypothetical protein